MEEQATTCQPVRRHEIVFPISDTYSRKGSGLVGKWQQKRSVYNMCSLFLPLVAGVQGFEPQLPDPEAGCQESTTMPHHVRLTWPFARRVRWTGL